MVIRSCVAVAVIAMLVATGWAAAQEPEVLTTPVPQSPESPSPPYQPEQPSVPAPSYQPYQPGAAGVYDPIRAVEDAYRIAEESRQAVISRQLQLQQSLRAYGVWNPTPYRYGLPYVYAYAPPRVARRVAREIDRWAPPAVVVPVPLLGGAYRYPYSPWAPSPWLTPQQGNGQAQASPKTYANRPPNAQPTQPQPPGNPAKPQSPTPAPPQPRPSAPTLEVPPEPATADPIPPPFGPEIIPAPPTEPGPKEF